MTEKKNTRTIESDEHGYPKIATIEVRGIEFPVYFSDSQFRAYVVAEDAAGRLAVTANSLELLRGMLMKHTASGSGKINVPVWKFESDVDESYRNPLRDRLHGENPRFERHFIRGIHGSTTNVLIRKEGGKTVQSNGYGERTGYFRGDMPANKREELIQTFRQEQAARDARKKLRDEWGIDLNKTAEDAVKQVVG